MPVVEHRTISDSERTVTYIEYGYDPDPNDTRIETLFTFIIRTADGLRVARDRHTTGLFLRPTWLRLLKQTGFTAELPSFKQSSIDRVYEVYVGIKKGINQ